METLSLNHYKGYKQDVKVTVVLCYKTISEHELLRTYLGSVSLLLFVV